MKAIRCDSLRSTVFLSDYLVLFVELTNFFRAKRVLRDVKAHNEYWAGLTAYVHCKQV